MQNNSIRNNLTKDDIISDIKLCMSAEIQEHKMYIVVEGEDDINLLNEYFNGNVYLYESFDGKNGVEQIVNQFFSKYKNVIGIRDKDYLSTPSSNKIFFYDNCCQEMMLIQNNEVFNGLYFEFYKGNLEKEELRNKIFSELKYLSIIRKLNETENLGIKINGVSINNAWLVNEEVIQNNVIVDKINSMNAGCIDESLRTQFDNEWQIEWEDRDYYNFTQGHDYFALFATICNSHSNQGISYKMLESVARCSFRFHDFIKTSLYSALVYYGEKHNVEFLNKLEMS